MSRPTTPVSHHAHTGGSSAPRSVPSRFSALTPLFVGAQKQREALHADEAKRARNDQLAKGQAPDYMVISCSDSRYAPTAVFAMEPGHIFEKQHVGAIVGRHDLPPMLRDSATLATVTYAVKVLKVKHVLILAHTSCGAVGAIMGGDKHVGLASRMGGSPLRRLLNLGVESQERVATQPLQRALQAAVDNLVRPGVDSADWVAREVAKRVAGGGSDVLDFLQLAGDVPGRVRAHYGSIGGEERQKAASAETAILQREHLLRYPVVQEAMAAGTLEDVQALVLELDTRVVNIYDDVTETYVPLNAEHSGLPKRRARNA